MVSITKSDRPEGESPLEITLTEELRGSQRAKIDNGVEFGDKGCGVYGGTEESGRPHEMKDYCGIILSKF